MEDLVAPLLGFCARLRVNGSISRDLEESIPVQYVTLVASLRNEDAVLDEFEAVYVVRLWLPRNGLPSGVAAFLNLPPTTGVSFNPVVPNSGLALVTLEENRLLSFVRVVHSCFSFQRGRLYDHLENVIVRAARQAVHRTSDLYDMESVDPWRSVGEDDWIVISNGGRRILAELSCVWMTSCLPEVSVLRSTGCGHLWDEYRSTQCWEVLWLLRGTSCLLDVKFSMSQALQLHSPWLWRMTGVVSGWDSAGLRCCVILEVTGSTIPSSMSGVSRIWMVNLLSCGLQSQRFSPKVKQLPANKLLLYVIGLCF